MDSEWYEEDYRRKKKSKPKVDEDSDHYGYTDTNAGKGFNNDFRASPMGEVDEVGVFRKRKQNKAKLLRKHKISKKCRCK